LQPGFLIRAFFVVGFVILAKMRPLAVFLIAVLMLWNQAQAYTVTAQYSFIPVEPAAHFNVQLR
jgi:hypothetical protein